MENRVPSERESRPVRRRAPRAWLAVAAFALALGGCVTHYYPAPPAEVVYEAPADSQGTVYHVPAEATWAEPTVRYVVSTRYYPWWSLDYFYLGYGSGCCGLSVGIGWGSPWYGPWYGSWYYPWYRPWYRPWYAWYDPWYWRPYYPHYPHHGHHSRHDYAYEPYLRQKWREEKPVSHPRDRVAPPAERGRERATAVSAREPKDRLARSRAAAAPVLTSASPALGDSGSRSAKAVRNRSGAKTSPYRELHGWERSGGDGSATRRVIPADGAATPEPQVRVISRNPGGVSAASVRSRAGGKNSSVRYQPVQKPRQGAVAPAVTAPRVTAPVRNVTPGAARPAPKPSVRSVPGAARSLSKPSFRPQPSRPPASAPAPRARPPAAKPPRAPVSRPAPSRPAPSRSPAMRSPGRDADRR